jgi:hypothetical protein
MSYPPEPWHLQGEMVVSMWRLPQALLPQPSDGLPPGVRPWTMGGSGLVGAAWVDYQPGGTLEYRELLAAVLTRHRGRPVVTISHIWVDSETSRDGGRALWGIPKDLATLTFTPDHFTATTPTATNPGATNPPATGPAATNAGARDSAVADSSATDPLATEAAVADSGATDPGATDAAGADVRAANPVAMGPAAPGPAAAGPAAAGPAATDAGAMDLAAMDLGGADLATGASTVDDSAVDGSAVEGIASATVVLGMRLPGRWPIRFRVAQTLDGRTIVSPIRVTAGIRRASAQWTVATSGPLGFLAGRRPTLTLALTDFRMLFGHPRP